MSALSAALSALPTSPAALSAAAVESTAAQTDTSAVLDPDQHTSDQRSRSDPGQDIELSAASEQSDSSELEFAPARRPFPASTAARPQHSRYVYITKAVTLPGCTKAVTDWGSNTLRELEGYIPSLSLSDGLSAAAGARGARPQPSHRARLQRILNIRSRCGLHLRVHGMHERNNAGSSRSALHSCWHCCGLLRL